MSVQRDPEGTEVKTLLHYVDFLDRRVLEVGCGDGRLTWNYARLARQIVGLDLDAQELRIARIDCPIEQRESTSFIRADSIHLPFSLASFDIAILAWSL